MKEERKLAGHDEEASALITRSRKSAPRNSKQQKSKNFKSNKKKVKKKACYFCNEEGHFKRNCPKRDEKRDGEGKKEEGNKSKPVAYMSSFENLNFECSVVAGAIYGDKEELMRQNCEQWHCIHAIYGDKEELMRQNCE